MPACAPRIGARLEREVVKLDNGKRSFAEICRLAGGAAERLGRPRPSYEQVRVLVHRSRAFRRGPSTARVVSDVVFRVRPPAAVVDHLSGVGVPTIR
jgi:hypothetical protein